MSKGIWRPYEDRYRPSVEDLSRRTYGDTHESAEECRRLAIEPNTAVQPQGRFVRSSDSNDVSGYAGIHTQPWMLQVSTRRLDVLPLTDPEVATEALDLLESLCRRHSVAKAQLRVLESMSDAVTLLGQRGYEQKEATWELVMEVEPTLTSDAGEPVNYTGFAIDSLAALIQTKPDVLGELHQLWVLVASDQPGYDPATTPPLDKFIAWMQSPGNDLGGILVAHTDTGLIGLTMLQARYGHPGSLTQNITGVVREWRGRGVGRALKFEGMRYARSVGASKVITSNSPDNERILKLNLGVGFVLTARWRLFERELGC